MAITVFSPFIAPKLKKRRRNIKGRIKWSASEKTAVETYFANYIKARKVPGKAVCEDFIEKRERLLSKRTWENVKDCVRNLGLKLKNTNKEKVIMPPKWNLCIRICRLFAIYM